jgi:polyhydroxybutyrate depolymerase
MSAAGVTGLLDEWCAMRGFLLCLVVCAGGCVSSGILPPALAPSPIPVPAPRGDAEVLPWERQYRLVVPASVAAGRPVPLVFAFHGIFEGKDFMPLYSHLDGLAGQEGFILVYPEARERFWPLVLDWSRDDLAFFDALYAHLTSRYNIDLNRVYLAGMSNGAYFAHLVALQRSDRIAAVAAHSGGLSCTWPGLTTGEVTAARKYPVLLIHGDLDPVVYVEESRRARDTYKRWGHEVEYVEIPNHTHLWAHEHGINERIWKFFMDHPRR